jgi:trigger factor
MQENPEQKLQSVDTPEGEKKPLKEPVIEALAAPHRVVIWFEYDELKELFDAHWEKYGERIIAKTGVKARTPSKARKIAEKQFKHSRIYGEVLSDIVYDTVDDDVMFLEGMELFNFDPKSDDLHLVAVFYYVPKLEMDGEINWEIERPPLPPEEEEMERRLKQIQRQYRTEASVEDDDAVIEENHEILMDVTASIEGQPYQMGSFQGQWMELKTLHYEELKEALLGRKKGDLFEVEFPARYDAEVNGKTVLAQVKVHDLKVITYPDINDDLAKDDGYEDLADFKKRFHDDYSKYVKNAETSTVVDNVLHQIMTHSVIPLFPQEWINKNVERMIAEHVAKNEGDKRKAMKAIHAPDEATLFEMMKGQLYREYLQQLASKAYCEMHDLDSPSSEGGSDAMFENMLGQVKWQVADGS